MNTHHLISRICLMLLVTAGSIPAQDGLQIKPAVELQLPTVPAKSYQLETSADLQTWVPWGPPMVGDSKIMRSFAPLDGGRAYFRATERAVTDLNALLDPIRTANTVPALGCVVVLDNQIAGLGAVGVRKWGVANSRVTVGDRWHHGSITKSMTATLAAMMVERGEIRWESTLAEIFPAWAGSMHEQWRGVTLEHLTSNRSGAPTELNSSGIWSQLQGFTGMPVDGRRLLLEKLTVLPPNAPPGTRYEYSNAGFSLAGHMLETVAGKAWEDLIRERLFLPLGMTSAGFGPPATARHTDHPLGHQLPGTTPIPVETSGSADNPPAVGPAGTVHSSLTDIARYVAFHLAGHRADTPLLSRASFLKLHTAYPNNADYAHGWSVLSRPWGGNEKVLTHNGSNTFWYTNIWFAPGRNFGVIATCNIAGSAPNRGAAATGQAVTKMIQEFLN